MCIFPEPVVISQKFEKSFLLFTFYTCCANFSSVALIFASESEFEKNVSIRIITRTLVPQWNK